VSENTKIEWADSTFNPWIGCTKVSPACDHCYAEALIDTRLHKAKWGPGQARVRTSVANWRKPLQWDAKRFMECWACGWRGECEAELIGCGKCGSIDQMNDARRRVFCASLADVFDNEVPIAWRIELFDLIRSTPDLDWLLLTKRIGNAEKMLDEAGGWAGVFSGGGLRSTLPNVWLGATVANQEEAARDIPKLLATPAAVRFLSIEPMLGRIDLCETLGMWWNQTMGCFEALGSRWNPRGLHWVIAGGESGPHARPSRPDWFRSLRDQCAAAGVPFLFKQWGEHAPNWFNDDAGNKIPDSEWIDRIGKKAAGRLLDGIEHNGFPEART